MEQDGQPDGWRVAPDRVNARGPSKSQERIAILLAAKTFGCPSIVKQPTSLAELIDMAIREEWCTRLFCTTCGARTFRDALRGIPRAEVIVGLRRLPREFVAAHQEIFRMIVMEAAAFPSGEDSVAPLAGTPAGDQLRVDVEFHKLRREKQGAYLESQAPEAIERRRAAEKAARQRATEPHRERKTAMQELVRAAATVLESTPPAEILSMLARNELAAPLQTIGGLAYKRLASHFRRTPARPEDIDVLRRFAAMHKGYWKKLLDRVISMPAAFDEEHG